MGDAAIEYADVVQEVRGAMQPGRLKLQGSGVIFKNIKTGKVDQFPGSDVVEVHWLVRARGQCLKFVLNSGHIHRFDGIRESEFDKLQSFVKKSYSVSLEKKDLSTKGWNWGNAKFTANSLDFEVSGLNAFDIPLANVSHSVTGKNEVTLEFHQNDDAAVSLMEMRFHIPADNNPEVDAVQEFYNNVLSKADIIQATGESLTTFQEVQCLTPRGRYDIKIYPTFLQLHGKTFDYKIPFTTILRFFLLPHRDNRQMFFAVSLDPPIKQGQTRYPFLIILFNKDDETTLELNLSDEELQSKYEGKLEREMSGPEYEIVSRVMKAVVNKKITVPGNFVGQGGTPSIACSYKAATGFLFPLERGFIFIHKPPIHVRFDEVSCVNFARSSGNTRSFDFEIETKAGVTYTFVGMEKDEYGKLYDFVTNKKLRVRNVGGKISGKRKDAAGNYDDDLVDSDEDKPEHDAYLVRMKREGKERAEDDDDGDSDSSDESFAPPESGSEVAEEFDSNPDSSDSEDSEEGGVGEDGEKKKKEKKEKKPKSAKTVKEPGMRKKRKTKADKDPNKPKRPPTSFILWLADIRESIKKENPGCAVTDVTKIAGEKWKKISETEKKKYEGLAAEHKVKYQKAMEEYNQKLEEEGPPSPKPTKKKASPKKKAPKSPAKTEKAGDFKSKEFISSEDESSSDNSDKPLKKKKKEDKPSKKKPKKDASDEEVGELPSDEEILSSPEHSASGSGSGEESGGGSDDESE